MNAHYEDYNYDEQAGPSRKGRRTKLVWRDQLDENLDRYEERSRVEATK